MRDGSILQGEWGGCEEPDWGPLEKILPLELCGPFMWMSDVELDGGGRLFVYKHSATRRYFHLDESGAPYRYVGPDLYVPIRHHDAVEVVFPPWWLLQDEQTPIHNLVRVALTGAVERDNAECARGVDPGPL